MKQLTLPAVAGILAGEVIVDLFAGGGGASEAIEQALGRSPDVAVNHDEVAIACHAANHPTTRHYQTDVAEVDPHEATGGLPVGLLHASPDCRHFSRAKGARPCSDKVRSLAWVVVKWAAAVAPRVITLENVEEFLTWGPLLPDGRPDPERKGETFNAWVDQLRALGYEVDWRCLRACDYGAPTTRRRLFVIARRDGLPIRWPEPSHGPGLEPYRTAAECIDWSLPCPSIFERKRPLAANTMRRIAKGVVRYVLEDPNPFIVRIGQTGDDAGKVHPLERPLSTVTTKAEHCLSVPTLIQMGYGERPGQAPRVPGLEKPLGTIVAGGGKHGLVAAWLAKHYGGAVGQDARQPIGTVTAKDHHSLVAAHLTKFYGTSTGSPLDGPAPTITGQAGGGHAGLVAAFLVHYYGSGGQWQGMDEPLHTIVSRPRHGLVTVEIAGESYVLADIGLRMLQPHELAAAHGFPPDYCLPHTKRDAIRLIGNSVPPAMLKAIYDANLCPGHRMRETVA